MTAGSSTVSPRIFSLTKATRRWCGSKVVWFEGNWSEYEADRRKRLGEDADNPKPIKYKTLTRQ